MKVVILAGGTGTRLSEESQLKPKPMVEIGGKPILWHIMKIYSHFGFNDFIICLGYKGYVIKEYFANYFLHESNVTFDFRNNNEQIIHNHSVEPWRVTLINTGENTMTGGRVKKIEQYIENDTFMLTYGDGVSDVNIKELLEFHKTHKKIATVTASQPSGRFGSLELMPNNIVNKFAEKPKGDNSWINAGFFILEPAFFKYLDDNAATILEKEPLENLANDKELLAYKWNGFWHPMDTLRDKNHLENLWNSGMAPWKLWK